MPTFHWEIHDADGNQVDSHETASGGSLGSPDLYYSWGDQYGLKSIPAGGYATVDVTFTPNDLQDPSVTLAFYLGLDDGTSRPPLTAPILISDPGTLTIEQVTP